MAGLKVWNYLSKRNALAIVGMVAAVASVAAPLTALRAQTAAASPKPHQLKVKKRDVDRTVAIPPALVPNYAAVAATLRNWSQPEIAVHVTTDQNDRRSPDQVKTLVTQGLGLWNVQLAGKIVFRMVDSADDADMEISFVPSGSLSGGRIGVTDISFTVPEGIIQHADIKLVEGMSSAQLVQAVAHESGHALGIQGHSDNDHDLMYRSAHLPAALTDRDAHTIAYVYLGVDTSKKREFKRGQKMGAAQSF